MKLRLEIIRTFEFEVYKEQHLVYHHHQLLIRHNNHLLIQVYAWNEPFLKAWSSFVCWGGGEQLKEILFNRTCMIREKYITAINMYCSYWFEEFSCSKSLKGVSKKPFLSCFQSSYVLCKADPHLHLFLHWCWIDQIWIYFETKSSNLLISKFIFGVILIWWNETTAS